MSAEFSITYLEIVCAP